MGENGVGPLQCGTGGAIGMRAKGRIEAVIGLGASLRADTTPEAVAIAGIPLETKLGRYGCGIDNAENV